MRTITSQIRAAFETQTAKRIGNTRTDGQTVWLHGNPIVRRCADGIVEVSWAGWETTTTRERISGITGARVNLSKRSSHLNGKPCDSTAWLAIA